MNLDLLRTRTTDQLIQEVVRGTQDPTKWTAEAEVVASFFISHFLCRRLFEIHDKLERYSAICYSSKQLAQKLSVTYEIEGHSRQFLQDFWIVHDGIYSDKNKILAELEGEFYFRPLGHNQLKVAKNKNPDLFRSIEQLLLASLTLEEIQKILAHRAFDELLRRKTVNNCPQLNRLFAFGNIDSASDYEKIIGYLLGVTNKDQYQVNKDRYELPKDSSTEKESVFNEVIAKTLKKMMATNGSQRLDAILRDIPLYNIMQKLRHENERVSKSIEHHQDDFKWRSNAYAVDENEAVSDRDPFDFNAYLPQLKQAFGEAKSNLIAAIWEIDEINCKVKNSQELATKLGKHKNTVKKHMRQLRNDPENLEKFQEIFVMKAGKKRDPQK